MAERNIKHAEVENLNGLMHDLTSQTSNLPSVVHRTVTTS